MLRGEIRLTDLDPAMAGEADKRRPAVIVSNDRANATAARLGRGVVTVVPVTSKVAILADGTDSRPEPDPVDSWTKGRRVSWIPSRKLP